MPAPSSSLTVASTGDAGGSAYLAAKVGGLECVVLVDSGANQSIIPLQIWSTISQGDSELTEYNREVSAANGGDMRIKV